MGAKMTRSRPPPERGSVKMGAQQTMIDNEQTKSAPYVFKNPGDLQKLVAGNTEFAVDIYSELCKSSEGNIFFSPISISVALAMTYLGARANTAKEMKQGLKIALDDDEMHAVYQEMTAFLQTDASSSFTLNTANRIFARKKYKFIEKFLEDTKKFYKADAQNLDFKASPERSIKVINKWVEDQTANKIRDLLQRGSVDKRTAMVLVNAIYFKGNWKEKFNRRETQPLKFKLGGGREVDVDMMYKPNYRNEMKYREDREMDCKIVELPYVQDHLSMFVILPNKDDGLAELGGKLTTAKIIELTTNMRKIDVDISLPKFKLEDQFSLNEVLQKLGMREMFNEGKADFSGMHGSKNRPMFVSSVVHKSFLDVNEEGTEAAAATAVTMPMQISRIIRPTMEFKADHPFLFFIIDNRTNGILFMGRLVNPK